MKTKKVNSYLLEQGDWCEFEFLTIREAQACAKELGLLNYHIVKMQNTTTEVPELMDWIAETWIETNIYTNGKLVEKIKGAKESS